MTIIEAKARSRPLLLTAGMLAAPIWILLAAAQAASRTGFDLTRHPISMLSLGDLGWIQVSSFLVTGVMTLCGAAGMRRAGLGGVWGASPARSPGARFDRGGRLPCRSGLRVSSWYARRAGDDELGRSRASGGGPASRSSR
ncbi:DUF998 domain-containing protein [Nonomuraea ferruginea]